MYFFRNTQALITSRFSAAFWRLSYLFYEVLKARMYLVFDTETTGLPQNWNAPLSDSENWLRCVQIAWQLHAPNGRMISHNDFIITADGFDIPFESEKVHGISTALAKEMVQKKTVVESFLAVVDQADFLVGHNLKFDLNIMGAELLRLGKENTLAEKAILDTCTEDTALLCELPGGEEESLNSQPLVNCTIFCSRIRLKKRITQQLMLKQLLGYLSS